MNIFDEIDPSLVEYFKSMNLGEGDLFCRCCGELLVPLDELKRYAWTCTSTFSGKPFLEPRLTYDNKATTFEPPNMRWVLFGKTMCGKTFFRHTCWKCFYEQLFKTCDVARKARKSKWYTRILNGERPIPERWTASSDYFKLIFDITDEELRQQKDKVAISSKSHFITKYGPELGEQKYKEYCARQAYTCSKEYMMSEKGMTEDEWNAFNKKRACTEVNFINRYGEEVGKKKWAEYCALEAYAGNSLLYFIEKYGKEEGERKFQEVEKARNFRFRQYSTVSQDLFAKIDQALGQRAEQSQWAKKNFEAELTVIDENQVKRVRRVDYFLDGKIIEFNGQYFHADPRKYKADDVLNICGGVKSASEIWKLDELRAKAFIAAGYKLKIVWEADYTSDPDQVVKDCVDFLNS